MLSSLRKVNADYHQIGWYQSTYLGPHFTQDFLRNHFGYQPKIEESVVLIYGEFGYLSKLYQDILVNCVRIS